MHGEDDKTIPVWHGKALYEKTTAPKMFLWVPAAQHDEVMWIAGNEYWKTLQKFLDLISSSNRKAPGSQEDHETG